MKNELKILMLEDSMADALLIEYTLRKGGLAFDCVRVEDREDFVRELDRLKPDLILSDHGLPAFDGFSALELSQVECPRIPFIFVTGASDQAMMVEMIESGATDYVFKNRLGDLVPAIKRALQNPPAIPSPAPLPAAAEVPRTAPAPGRNPLSAFLCSVCKKVLGESERWVPLDDFLKTRPQTALLTTVCPACQGLLI